MAVPTIIKAPPTKVRPYLHEDVEEIGPFFGEVVGGDGGNGVSHRRSHFGLVRLQAHRKQSPNLRLRGLRNLGSFELLAL